MSRHGDESVSCSNCNSLASVREGVYQFKESGLSNVSLSGVDLITCEVCGNIDPVIPNVNELMATLAWYIATQKYRLSGEEVRFLRKYLKMSATDFAKLIGSDKSTMSKWENNKEKPGSSSERLIRSVVLSLGEGIKDRAEEGIRTFDWIIEEFRPEPMQINMDTLELQET